MIRSSEIRHLGGQIKTLAAGCDHVTAGAAIAQAGLTAAEIPTALTDALRHVREARDELLSAVDELREMARWLDLAQPVLEPGPARCPSCHRDADDPRGDHAPGCQYLTELRA